jgi:hypothetical protein
MRNAYRSLVEELRDQLEDLETDGNVVIKMGRAMAQAVSRRYLIVEARVRTCSVHGGFVMDRVALGQIYLRVLWFYPVNIIPPFLFILMYHRGG